jgi:predicted permease
VVLALAFGIGATTAIFTLVDALLLRPLPVSRPEQLVGFGDQALVGVTNTGPPSTASFSYELYLALRDRTRLVSGLVASGYSSRFEVVVPDPLGAAGAAAARGGDAAPERARGRLVSGNYFAVLGVRAAAGRTLVPDDDRAPGAGPVAVISDGYWRRRFGRDPAVVGRTVLVNRTPITIVGVAAPGFAGEVAGTRMDVWMPLTMQPLLTPNQDWLHGRNTSWLLLFGRLRPGATPGQAGAELTLLARRAIAEGGGAPSDTLGARVEAYDARRGIFGAPKEVRPMLLTLLALALVVLLVVGANVANLLLARAVARRTEIGVRLAMGAGRLRVMRHLLAESVLLGAAAGVLAVLVVQGASALLTRQLGASGEPLPVDGTLGGRVLAFAAALSLATATVLGLVPATQGTRVDLAAALRSQGRGVAGGPSGGSLGSGRGLGLGRWLVVGQVSLSLVLLAGAGLLVRTAAHLGDLDVGVARDELLIVSVDANAAGYRGDRAQALYRQLAERLERLPGVRAVTYSQNGLFSGIEASATFQVDGFVARSADDTSAFTDQVGPGYFRTIGARIVRGRDVEARDDARSARVAVINESTARFYFGARDPIGQSFRIDTTRYTIVGVSADVIGRDLRAGPTRRLYTAIAQGGGGGLVVFELRIAGDPARLADAARRAVLAADAALRVRAAQPLAALMRESIAPQRVVASLAGVAGGLALALTALGLYGVMSYTIARRTNEFGLRMALGARPWDVTRMVLRETMGLVALGAAVGLPAALGAAQLLRHQLVGVGLVDPPTLAAALAVLVVVAAAAGYRPASRAANASPQSALRER